MTSPRLRMLIVLAAPGLLLACHASSDAPTPDSTIPDVPMAVATTTVAEAAPSTTQGSPEEASLMLGPVRAFDETLGEEWQRVFLESVANSTVVDDDFKMNGGVRCVEGAVGVSTTTGFRAPVEGVGEWTTAEPPSDRAITFGLLESGSGQNYATANRVVVIVSDFEDLVVAADVVERFRHGMETTCSDRRVQLGLPDGLHDGAWTNSVVIDLVEGADDSVVMEPVVTTDDGVVLSNPPVLGIARVGARTVFVVTYDDHDRFAVADVLAFLVDSLAAG